VLRRNIVCGTDKSDMMCDASVTMRLRAFYAYQQNTDKHRFSELGRSWP